MNAFCPNLSNKEVKQQFDELTSLFGEDAAYFLWDKNNGYSLDKAPNGANSILFKSLLSECKGDRQAALIAKAKTYSSNFTNWFGDWTKKDKTNVSKVVDENGEPLVVYHTISGEVLLKGEADFTTFDPNYEDKSGENPAFLYFTDNKEMSESYLNDNRAWKNIDEVNQQIDKKTSLINKLKPNLKLTDREIIANFAKRINMSVEELIKDSGFESIDEFLKQNWRNYTHRGIQEQIDELVQEIDFLNKFKNNPKLLNPTRAFYINEKNPYIVNGNGKNWDQLSTSGENVDELIEESKNAEKYKNELLKELFHKYVDNDLADVLTYDDLIDMVPVEELDKIEEKINKKYPNLNKLESTRSIEEKIKNEYQFDGTFIKNISDWGSFSFKKNQQGVKETGNVIAVRRTTQIKSIDNEGTFSNQNDSVYGAKQDIVEPYNEVLDYIRQEINTKFRGNYYDVINRIGKPAYEQIKQNIKDEFNKKFKHWTLKLGPNQEGQLRGFIPQRITDDLKDLNKWEHIIFNDTTQHGFLSKENFDNMFSNLLTDAKGASLHMQLVTELLRNVLKEKYIRFEIKSGYYFQDGQAAKCNVDGYIYTIQINKDAFFVNDSNFKNRITQTILHELLHVATEHALRNNKQLQEQAEKLLNTVRHALGKDAKDYGLSNIYEFFAELSNEKFINKLKSIEYKSEETKEVFVHGERGIRIRVWTTLLDKVKQFIKDVSKYILDESIKTSRYKSLLGIGERIAKHVSKFENTAYDEAMRLLMSSALYVGNTSEYDDNTVYSYGMIQDKQSGNTEIQDKVYKQFDILYKAQQKIPNKTLKQQLKQNKTFETLTKLKTLSEIDSIKEVLEFANNEFGSFNGNIDDTILKRLKDSRELAVPYDDITPDELCEIYQNGIMFFDNLVNSIFENITVENKTTPYIDDLLTKIRSSITDAKSMWKDALDVVTDKLIEKWVNEDLIIVDSLGDNPTEVIKDYLHRNALYKDTNNAYMWIFSLANQQSPLVKIAFSQIQNQETKIAEESGNICIKLAKAYEKVNKLTRLNPFWQKTFMEFDKNGLPTGYFIRPINRGQYMLDVDDFVKQLNKDFQDKYGYHYVVDDTTGEYINSETGAFAYDEEWTDEQPTFIDYLLAIQKYKCSRANLRFTYDYYKERLSRPFDANLDPDKVSGDYLETHHGLSLKTLKKYNQIQSNINYYLSKCKDKKTGLPHPERMENPEDQSKLDMWTNELKKLSNAYNEDGTIKTDDELQTAYELKAWQRWIGQKMENAIDYEGFEKELKQYQDEVDKYQPGTKERREAENALAIFLKYNSREGIHPELLKMMFGGENVDRLEFGDMTLARIQRGMLKQTVSGTSLVPDLKRVANNIQFFIDCKKVDQLIENEGEKTTVDDKFKDYLTTYPVLYITAEGKYLDKDMNETEDEDEAITFQQYLIEHYTQHAIDEGQIPGLMDEQDNPIMFNQWSEKEIRDFFFNLFSIEKIQKDGSTGNNYIEYKPLSVFGYLKPLQHIFFDKNKKPHPTIIHIPQGRFAHKHSNEFINENYNELENQSEQPLKEFYDNSENYDKMRKNTEVSKLYDLFIQYMQSAQNDMQFQNDSFDFKLPKIEASNNTTFARSLKHIGEMTEDERSDNNTLWKKIKYYSKKILNSAAESYFSYNTNDADNRTDEEQYIGPDQMVNNNVPIKYVGMLKDRYKYSYDVTSSVIRYCSAALEYKYKQQIQSALQAVRYAQEPTNRKENVNDTPHNREIYDYMMRTYMYKTSRIKSKYDKIADMFRTAGVFQMLGLNILSVSAGLFDSLVAIIRDGLVGRYYSAVDLTRSLAYNIPTILMHILNYGKTVPNNKIAAFNHMFGLKSIKELSDQIDDNRIKKLLEQTALGAYSVIDFMTNNIMLHSMLTSYRFYDGDLVPKGFYRKYDLQRMFLKAGYSKSKASLAYLTSMGKSLWGAYRFKDGELWLDPKYEPYITGKIKKNLRSTLGYRSQVNNGTTPTDGKPRYQDSILGKFIGAMRGWMTSSLQERISGRDDTSVRKKERLMKESIKNGKPIQKVVYKLLPKTKEQKEARKSWNFSTGLPQPEIAKALTRSFGVLSSTLVQLLSFGKHKARKFSEAELFAIKTVCVEMSIIIGMIQSYQYVDDWCSDVRPINIRKESPYSMQEMLDSKLYKEIFRNSYIRTVNSRIEQFDPTMVYDVVNSISTLSTAVKNVQNVPQFLLTHDLSNLGEEVIGGNNIVRQGKFRGYHKWDSTWRKSIGLLNNVQSAFTYNGVSANTAFYSRSYAWWLKYINKEYSPQKLKYNKNASSGEEFDISDFKGDFDGGFDKSDIDAINDIDGF